MESLKRLKSFVFFILIFLLILLGVYLRFKGYAFNKPLWLDECFLYNNLSKEYFQLFGALSYCQSSPPIFLIAEKFIMENFGMKEYVLRAFPFVCSIISVPVFYYFSKIFLKKISIIAAMFLFAVNIQLIYYGAEMKQYSSDVLCFMLLFIFLNKLSIKNLGKKQIIIYSLLIMFVPLISLPSYFLIGAWFLRELITSKKDWPKLVAAHIPLGTMSLFYLVYTLLPQHISITLVYHDSLQYQGFMSLNIISNIKLLIHNLKFYFEPNSLAAAYLLFILIGFFTFLKNYKQKENLLLILFMAIPIVFSAFHIYPLYERVYLYALPALIVMLVKFIDILSKNKITLLFGVMIFLLLFKQYDLNYFKKGFLPVVHSDSRSLIQMLMSNYNKNDTVIIGVAATPEYLYYKKYYGFSPSKEIFIDYKELYKKQYKKYLKEVTEPDKTYILFYALDFSIGAVEASGFSEWIKNHKLLSKKVIEESEHKSYIARVKNSLR